MSSLSANTPSRIPELDGIRGLAILMVLIWHYFSCQLHRDAGIWVSYARRLLYLTGTGVDLFFVLSGFLIVGILLDQRGSQHALRTFYLRRACRIFPLYFLLIILFIALDHPEWWALESYEWLFGNPMPLWAYATFNQNILMGLRESLGANFLAVTWSLAVEEQFYLIIPWIVLWVSRRNLAWLFLAALICVPLLRITIAGFHAYINTPWRADAMVAGGLLAILARSSVLIERIRANRRWLTTGTILLLAVVPVVIVFPGCLGGWTQSWLAATYAALILIATSGTHPLVSEWLSHPGLLKLGQLSYGIYMFHQPASGWLHGWIRQQAPKISDPLDAAITLLALVLTFAVAWISYRFFESPILRFGHRFQYAKMAIKAP
ncbi:MAG: acyltransferase [Verrucomicrobia bacterium]|nr:acyltransferase [Verrucomicrobiota bacterium]